MTYRPYAPVALDLDNASGDAFGRLRVSEPHAVFESKQILDNGPFLWDSALESGAGITDSWSKDEAATTITSTASTAGLFTRQSRQRINYQPGRSQQILMTGVIAPTAGAAGVTRRIGQFDDANGLFFADMDGAVNVVTRSNVTGSVVETAVTQGSWNVDTLDGTGPSGVTVDWSKAQIFVIDYEWLGVGRVRFGVDIGGHVMVVHQVNNANANTGVYMSTPNAPLRYQLETTAAAPAAELVHICAVVHSEGGAEDLGVLHWRSTGGTHIDANTTDSVYVVAAVRLKSTHLDAAVQVESVSLVGATPDAFEWVLYFNPTTSAALSYAGVENSAVEFAVGTGEQVTGFAGGRQITGGFASESTAVSAAVRELRRLGALVDGTRDVIALGVRPLSSNLDVDGGLSWREVG